jgi:hypothetical protein
LSTWPTAAASTADAPLAWLIGALMMETKTAASMFGKTATGAVFMSVYITG